MSREVVLYTRPNSILSSQMQAMMMEAGVQVRVHEVTSREEQEALTAAHGAAGFPFVVGSGVYLGGFPEILQMHADGGLRLLAERTSLDPPPPAAAARAPLPKRPSSGAFRAAMVAISEGGAAPVSPNTRTTGELPDPTRGSPRK